MGASQLEPGAVVVRVERERRAARLHPRLEAPQADPDVRQGNEHLQRQGISRRGGAQLPLGLRVAPQLAQGPPVHLDEHVRRVRGQRDGAPEGCRRGLRLPQLRESRTEHPIERGVVGMSLDRGTTMVDCFVVALKREQRPAAGLGGVQVVGSAGESRAVTARGRPPPRRFGRGRCPGCDGVPRGAGRRAHPGAGRRGPRRGDPASGAPLPGCTSSHTPRGDASGCTGIRRRPRRACRPGAVGGRAGTRPACRRAGVGLPKSAQFLARLAATARARSA